MEFDIDEIECPLCHNKGVLDYVEYGDDYQVNDDNTVETSYPLYCMNCEEYIRAFQIYDEGDRKVITTDVTTMEIDMDKYWNSLGKAAYDFWEPSEKSKEAFWGNIPDQLLQSPPDVSINTSFWDENPGVNVSDNQFKGNNISFW